MNKLFLIFNHEPTEEQTTQAKEMFKIYEIIRLTENLKKFWNDIQPDINLTPEMFQELKNLA